MSVNAVFDCIVIGSGSGGSAVARLATTDDVVATKGTFRMDYQVWEFCHIVSGRCVITPEGRAAGTFGPGDSFICEKGLKGTWQILEEMTKHFVMNF